MEYTKAHQEFGLDNVKRIVDKYDGTMVIECDNGRFDIDVIMFVG